MGISGSQPALMYALGGVARGGATRAGYTSGLPFISLGGRQIGMRPQHRAWFREAVLAAAPLQYYRLDETTGTQAADSSGHNYHGTYQAGMLIGDPLNACSDQNRSAQFPGTSGVGVAITGVPVPANFSIETIFRRNGPQSSLARLYASGAAVSFPFELGLEGIAGGTRLVYFLNLSSAYRARVLADGPIEYWRLGEGSGTVALAQINGANNGTYQNGPTLGAAGALADGDSAVTFDGVDDRVQIPQSTFNPNRTTFTYEAWVKFTDATTRIIMGRLSGAPSGAIIYTDNGGRLRTIGYDNTAATVTRWFIEAPTPINNGQWRHVALTVNTAVANGIKLWVDGAVVAQTTAVGTAGSASGQFFYIGSYNLGDATQWKGSIDEVAIYGGELSGATLAAHYALRATGNTSGWQDTGIVIPDQTWVHATLTWDGTTLKCYTGATLGYSTAAYAGRVLVNVGSTAGQRTIGDGGPSAGGSPFKGWIDELAIYDRALSASEVATLDAAIDKVGPSEAGTLIESLNIVDVLDETPNRATFTTRFYVPQSGAEIVITLGSINNLQRLFAGFATNVTQRYALDRPANVLSDVAATDYSWFFSFLKVTKRYRNQSASAIAADLITTYAAANGFTAGGVAADLPAIDEITFTNEDLGDAFTRLARRIGAYWKTDYQKVVYLGFSFTDNGTPVDLTPAHKSLAHFAADGDRTQGLTRVYVEGRGSRLRGAVGVGDSRIPLESLESFAVAADVFAKVSFQGSEGGAQHLNFSGVVKGGAGGMVGPGIGPSAAPSLAGQTGGSIEPGAHGYAATFTTAAGESLPSPVVAINLAAVPNPTVAPTVTQNPTGTYNGSFIPIGKTMYWSYCYVTEKPDNDITHWKTTALAPAYGPIVTVSNNDPLNPTMSAPPFVTMPGTSDPRVIDIALFQWHDGYWAPYSTASANGVSPVYGWTWAGYGSGLNNTPFTPTNNSQQNAVALGGIPIGASSVTGRKLYRTAAGASQLKLVATIANNSATTYTDTAADATLGANAPAADTSGLQQPDGQVLPGSNTLPVANMGAFEAAGGWAEIGNGEQVIRYTAVTAGALTGIPTSGIGAITAAVSYNSTVTACPMLTGIPASGPRSIASALAQGDEIYLVVQVDDATAQAALAAIMKIGSGVREEWVQDRRLGIPEARGRGQATIAMRPLEQRRARYTCRDLRTASGKTITVNLPAPTSVTGTFKIQQVTIANFRPHPNQYPTFTVDASSAQFSFEDLLRRYETKV